MEIKITERINEYVERLNPLTVLALILIDLLEFGASATTLGLVAPISTLVGILIGAPVVFIIQTLSSLSWEEVPQTAIDTIIAVLLLAVPFPIMSVALGIWKTVKS